MTGFMSVGNHFSHILPLFFTKPNTYEFVLCQCEFVESINWSLSPYKFVKGSSHVIIYIYIALI